MKCAYCGKAVRKQSVIVYVFKEPTSYHRESSYCRYYYYGDKPPPQNMSDCQRLTNRKVISIVRSDIYEDGVLVRKELRSWNEWDGESYSPSYKYFCTNNCAGWFACTAVERLTQRKAS